MDELINIVQAQTGATKSSSRDAVRGILDYIAEMGRKERVVLTGFGTFFPRVTSEREGVAPSGVSYVSPKSLTLGFKASKNLKTQA